MLQTERLVLREFEPDDDAIFYYLNSNPNVLKYTGDKPFSSILEARIFLENYSDYQKNGYGRWAVLLKSTKEFIGWCGLKFGEIEDETDIGFRFFERQWNKGYATESAAACLEYGFKELGLKRIIGRAMKNNLGSIKVLKNIGMQFEKEIDFEGQPGVIYMKEHN